jgi:hypothetical protein
LENIDKLLTDAGWIVQDERSKSNERPMGPATCQQSGEANPAIRHSESADRHSIGMLLSSHPAHVYQNAFRDILASQRARCSI